MGTTISEGSYASAKTGRPPENRNTGFSAFRNIDQPERAAPDVEETLHRPEDALTAQEVNRRSTMDGATPGNGVLRKPSAEYRFKKGLASAVHQSSAQAAEGALIDQILSGHKELFMELIRPHQRTVYATAFALLVNRQDAEDVAQDALLKALARLNQFRRESSFGTWLIQIAINEARMRNRQQWRLPVSYTHLTLPTICSV